MLAIEIEPQPAFKIGYPAELVLPPKTPIKVHIDFETYSECDITKQGAWVYACHPSTEVVCMAYAIGDEAPELWLPGEALPDFLNEHVVLHAWNSFFEYCIWHNTLKWPAVPISYWDNTQAHAMALSLPRALGECGGALGFNQDKVKDKRGRRLIQVLCKPYRGKRIQDPELLDELYNYCKQDVIAERHIAQKLMPINPKERKLWEIDQRMNIRGLPIDRANVLHAIAIYEAEKSRLTQRLKSITQLDNPNSRQQFFDWLHAQGVKVANVQASTLEKLTDVTDSVKAAIDLRMQLARTPVAKYESMLDKLSEDDQLRGFQIYHGASTGRWAHTGVNFQNLPRPVIEDIDACIEDFKHEDPNIISSYGGNIMDALSSCIRGMIKAPKGRQFYIADYAAIEARVLAWLARQEDVLDVFRTHGLIYEQAAAGIYRVPIREVTKPQRAVGKVACIAEDEPVLTDKGLIPIQHVTSGHRVWDGLNWVNCDGAIYKGEKEVITYDGLTATKDHIVFTDDGRQLPFGTCASKQIPLAKTGFGRQTIRLGEGNIPRSNMEATTKKMGFKANVKSLLYRLQNRKTYIYAQSSERQNKRLSKLFTASKSPKMVGQKINGRKATLSESQRCKLVTLWWPRNKVSFSLCFRGLFMGSKKFRFASTHGVGSYRQRRPLQSWKSSMGKQKSEYTQQTNTDAYSRDDRLQNEIPRNKICRQYFKKFLQSWAIFQGNNRSVSPKFVQTKRRVWDILNAGPNNRFTVSDILAHNCLALGYQGGYRAFQQMAKNYRVDITDNEAKAIVSKWRAQNTAIVKFWHDCERAAIKAIQHPGESYPVHRLVFRCFNQFLFCKLPSKRLIAWHRPTLVDDHYGRQKIEFMGRNSMTRRWERMSTYGGMIVENATQAVARDIMANAMLTLDEQSYRIVLTVHDEIVVEVAKADSLRTLAHFTKIMNQKPAWADGLPIKAEAIACQRYQK